MIKVSDDKVDKKIKVFHVITKLELGGAQQNTLYTVSNLDRSRFEVGLVTSDRGIMVKDALAIEGAEKHLIPSFIREINPKQDFKTLVELIRIFRLAAPNIVHTHSSKAGVLGRVAAKLAGVPVIIHSIHGFGFNPLQPKLMRWCLIGIEKLISRFTTHFICVSQANLEVGTRLGIIRDINKTSIIRSGIEIDKFGEESFDTTEERKKLGIDARTPVVGMVACFKPQKSPLDFVEAARKVKQEIPKAKFIMVGDGVLRGSIEDRIRDLELENDIILTGWRRDVAKLMHIFDLLTLTSIWEGLPRVFPQAMAAGIPIVATQVDGASEAVRNGINGYLVNPGDIDSMAERIVYLIRNYEQRKEMGLKGKGFVNEFDIDFMVKQQEHLYVKLMEDKTGGHKIR